MSAASASMTPQTPSATPCLRLPRIFAVAQPRPQNASPNSLLRKGPHRLRLVQAEALPAEDTAGTAEAMLQSRMPEATERGRYAFYRKYTEGMLRRAMKMSLEVGRVPSFLGRELFRGDVTHCTVSGFDDVVIFVADIDRCIALLDKGPQYLIRRIGMQQYTQAETAEMTGIPLRNVIRRYNRALDDLTRILLERQLMQREFSDAMKGVEITA